LCYLFVDFEIWALGNVEKIRQLGKQRDKVLQNMKEREYSIRRPTTQLQLKMNALLHTMKQKPSGAKQGTRYTPSMFLLSELSTVAPLLSDSV